MQLGGNCKHPLEMGTIQGSESCFLTMVLATTVAERIKPLL